MSDWKESAIKKRDFQHSKSDPEIPKHRKKRVGKKPWKIIIKGYRWFNNKETDWVFGRYKTEQAAKDAIKSHANNFWGKYEMTIEKDD